MGLKYYAEEDARHREVLAIKWTFQECVDATNALCDEYKLPRIPVQLRTGGRSSFYNTGKRRIHYLPTMLNPLTVAHEFAHYRDHMFRLAERDAKNEAAFENWEGGVGFQPIGIDRKTRWHGIRHLRYTDQAVAVLQKLPFFYQFKADRMAMIRAAASIDPVQAAFNALPHFLCCPKCANYKAKASFGMRVMSRDASGQPLKVVRQSYCRECR